MKVICNCDGSNLCTYFHENKGSRYACELAVVTRVTMHPKLCKHIDCPSFDKDNCSVEDSAKSYKYVCRKEQGYKRNTKRGKAFEFDNKEKKER